MAYFHDPGTPLWHAFVSVSRASNYLEIRLDLLHSPNKKSRRRCAFGFQNSYKNGSPNSDYVWQDRNQPYSRHTINSGGFHGCAKWFDL